MYKTKFSYSILAFALLIISCKSKDKIQLNSELVYGTVEKELHIKAIFEFLRKHHRDDCKDDCEFTISPKNIFLG